MWVLTLGVYMPRHISMAICVCQVNTVHIYCDLLGPSVQSVQHVDSLCQCLNRASADSAALTF